MRRVVLVLAAAAAPMAFAGQGHATVTLPGVTSTAICANNQLDPEVVEGVTSCTISGDVSHVSLSPAVQLTSSARGPDFGVASGSASVQYFFEVVGGSTPTDVPVIILTNMAALASGDGGASAQIMVNTEPGGDESAPIFNAFQTVCSNPEFGCGAAPAIFSGALHVTAVSGVAAQVNIGVLTGATEDGAADVFADPMIEIDPTFADASLFSIVLSPGVGNALPTTGGGGGVPEPATWALMLAGFGLVGAWMRRRREGVVSGLA